MRGRSWVSLGAARDDSHQKHPYHCGRRSSAHPPPSPPLLPPSRPRLPLLPLRLFPLLRCCFLFRLLFRRLLLLYRLFPIFFLFFVLMISLLLPFPFSCLPLSLRCRLHLPLVVIVVFIITGIMIIIITIIIIIILVVIVTNNKNNSNNVFFLIIFSSSISNLLSLCVFSLSFRRFSSFLTCFFSSCLRLFLFSIFFFLFWLFFPSPFLSPLTVVPSLLICFFFRLHSASSHIPCTFYHRISFSLLFAIGVFFVIVIMVSHHRHRLRLPRHELVEE